VAGSVTIRTRRENGGIDLVGAWRWEVAPRRHADPSKLVPGMKKKRVGALDGVPARRL